MSVFINKSNIYNETSQTYINDHGIMKLATPYINDHGIWKATQVKKGVNIGNYNDVIYIDNLGSDIAGDGTENNPYATVDKVLQLPYIDNTLLFLGDGDYEISIDAYLDTTKKLSIYGNGFNTNLCVINTYHVIMDEYLDIINLSLYTTNYRVYIYFYDDSLPKIKFQNVLFKQMNNNPRQYSIFTNNSDSGVDKDIYYDHCTFETETFQYGQYQYKSTLGHYSKCVTKNSFIIDADNLRNATLDDQGFVISNNPDNMGIYGGDYAWDLS